jgi:hypothetical protein
MMNQQTSRTAVRRPQQSVERSEKTGRVPSGESAGLPTRFYRPRFKVTLPEGEAGFVPGYN